MNKDQITNLILKAGTIGGSLLAANGYGTASNWQLFAGALATLVSLVWSHFWAGSPSTVVQSNVPPKS